MNSFDRFLLGELDDVGSRVYVDGERVEDTTRSLAYIASKYDAVEGRVEVKALYREKETFEYVEGDVEWTNE